MPSNLRVCSCDCGVCGRRCLPGWRLRCSLVLRWPSWTLTASGRQQQCRTVGRPAAAARSMQVGAETSILKAASGDHGLTRLSHVHFCRKACGLAEHAWQLLSPSARLPPHLPAPPPTCLSTGEAALVMQLLAGLLAAGLPGQDVGIMSPYKAQVHAMPRRAY